MNIKKRFFSISTIILMLITMIPGLVFADDESSIQTQKLDIYFDGNKVANGGYDVTKIDSTYFCTGELLSYYIPKKTVYNGVDYNYYLAVRTNEDGSREILGADDVNWTVEVDGKEISYSESNSEVSKGPIMLFLSKTTKGTKRGIWFNDCSLIGKTVKITATDTNNNSASMSVRLDFNPTSINTEPAPLYSYLYDAESGEQKSTCMPGKDYYFDVTFNSEWNGFFNKGSYADNWVTDYLQDKITVTSDNTDVIDTSDINSCSIEPGVFDSTPKVRIHLKAKSAGSATLDISFKKDNVETLSLKKAVSFEGAVLSPIYVRLNEGETAQLTYDVSNAGLDEANTQWESTDPSIATVDDKGLVTAKGNGECYILVTNGDYSAKARISTWKNGIYIEGEYVEEYEFDVTKGSTTLNLDVMYNDVIKSQDYWYSSNTSIAEITSAIQVDETGHAIDNGIVTFKKDGTVTIYAVEKNPSTNFAIMGKCVIKVTGFGVNGDNDQKWETVTEPQGLYDKVRLTNYTVETQEYRDDIYENMITDPIYANNCSFVIEATGQSKGDLSEDRKQKIIENAMSKVYICEQDENGNPGDVVASYNDGFTLDNVEFNTDDRWIITYDISVDKKLKPLKRGSSYVLLITSNFGHTDTSGTIGKRAVYKFDTIPAASKVTISQEEATLNVGETLSLEAKLLGDNPEIAPDDVLIWDTPDDSVTVDQEGNVTAVKPGTSVVTAKAFYGEVAAQCTITVVGEPADPSDPDNPSGGDSEPSVNPDNPSDDNGNSSDNPSGDNDASNDNPSDDASAKTGDSMNIWMLMALLAVSGAAGAAALRRRAKQ